MPLKRIGKKLLRIIWISAGSLIILLTAFHFWVVYHAEEIIQDLVEVKSKGKLKLEVRNFKFNWFSRKMELQDAVFYSTDSMQAGTTYRFAVNKIKIKVKAVWPVIVEKSVLINELELRNPDITVTRLRPSKDKVRGDKVSVPQEMGRIYNSIQDALQVLQVKKFQFEDGSFKLINKIQPDQQPIYISHIDLTIHNLKVDTAKLTGKEKLFFSDNVVLKSRNQDILFPDRRHRLAFQKFRINIEKKLVEFDSCTIAAIKTEKSATGFSISFDKLVMTDIDFDTLYRNEVIKADSVYCSNPVFRFTADLDKRKKNSTTSPRLDEIIRKLTGDLLLNFVVVNNASFDINTIKAGNPSSFRSQKNNFEMRGLRIDDDAERPLKVEKFVMAIRDYENFLRDSLYALQFDSIQVNNDRIFLNNFSFQKLHNGKPINNFSVPRFQLTGLDWDDLLFERKLTARQAVLYNPVIDYTASSGTSRKKKKRNLFDMLSSINEVLMLEDMNIMNGNIRLRLADSLAIDLENASLSVESRSLLGSSQLSGIRRSVNYLDFSKGMFRLGDLTVLLDSINYAGVESRLKAKSFTVSNSTGTVKARADAVGMNEIFINEFTGDVSIGGLNWQKAAIEINTWVQQENTKKRNASFFSLTDIDGHNTSLQMQTGNKKLAGFIGRMAATAFILKPGEKPFIAGLQAAGSDWRFTDSNLAITAAAFTVEDQQKAIIENLVYQKSNGQDSVTLTLEKLSFLPNVQTVINGQIHSSAMLIQTPVLFVHSSGKKEKETKPFLLPEIMVEKLTIEKPVIHFSGIADKGNWSFHWNGINTVQPPLVFHNVSSNGPVFKADRLNFFLNNFRFTKENGISFVSNKAQLSGEASDLLFQKEKDISWQANFPLLEGTEFIFGKANEKKGQFTLNRFRVTNTFISHSTWKNIRSWVAANEKTRIDQITGAYLNPVNRINWFGAAYDQQRRLFTADSFAYSPVAERDAFIKNLQYQQDYFKVKTGSLAVGPFSIDAYFADSVVRIEKITVNNIQFDDYRDKRLPFRSGIIKPLLTNKIKSIPLKLSVDTVQLQNVAINYTELNPQTKLSGTIPVSRLELMLSPVKNTGIAGTDSLRLTARGYLFDTALVNILLSESYTDSLAGFLLLARIDETDLQVINPVLMPLSSVKIRSGYLDSLVMRVNGDEYYAYGEMDMHYHDLKIRILRTADLKQRKFRTAIMNFIANSFIIKNKNSKRTGLVFFVRNRDRSSLNYLVKMLMSGVNSSIGLKTTRKNFRPHKKALRQRNLPAVEYDY